MDEKRRQALQYLVDQNPMLTGSDSKTLALFQETEGIRNAFKQNEASLSGAQPNGVSVNNQTGGQPQGDRQSFTDLSMYGKALKILGNKGPITQTFGNFNPQLETYSGGVNYGVDIGVPTGTRISAPPEGAWKVVSSYAGNGMNSGYGKSVMLQNTETGEKLRFSHLSQVGVKQGQTLKGGSIVGLSGSTGNSTGSHIDVEMVDKNGQLIDVLKSRYGKYL